MVEKEEASETLFDEAQSKIYSLMKRDSYPRYQRKLNKNLC